MTPEQRKELTPEQRQRTVEVAKAMAPDPDVFDENCIAIIGMLSRGVLALDAMLTRTEQERDALAMERRVSDSEMVALLKRVNKEYHDRTDAAESSLRSLACTLSVGGYNSEEFNASVFQAKIMDGIDMLTKPLQDLLAVEREKTAAAARECVRLAAERDALRKAPDGWVPASDAMRQRDEHIRDKHRILQEYEEQATKLRAERDAMKGELESTEASHDDEEAAHADTLRLLELAKQERDAMRKSCEQAVDHAAKGWARATEAERQRDDLHKQLVELTATDRHWQAEVRRGQLLERWLGYKCMAEHDELFRDTQRELA